MENDVRLIDANALKKSLRESHGELMRMRNNMPYGEERKIADAQLVTFSECILRLKEQPTVDPEPLRPDGLWLINIPDDNDKQGKSLSCSRCGTVWANFYLAKRYFRFCPNCGARMVEK